MRLRTARFRRAPIALQGGSLWLLAGLLSASCLQSPDSDLFTPSTPSVSPGGTRSGGGTAGATGGSSSAQGGAAASPGEPDAGGAPARGGETAEPPRGGSSSAGSGGTAQAGTGGAGGSGGMLDPDSACSELTGVIVSATGHCYRGSEAALGFAEADAACVAEGGYLVTIGSAEENELVEDILVGENWIGATDRRDSGVPGAGAYQWVTSEPFVYAGWYPGQPNALAAECPGTGNADDDCYEHCAAMRNDGAWNDRACWEELTFVCEWDPVP